ncbi:MAG TPA: hypothetical protein VGF61_21955 [Candidatus Acidoferrum sp.]|jgi:hypothetical protein
MQRPVDSALPGFPSASPKGSRIPWFVVVGCLYFVSLGVGFRIVVPMFSKLYPAGVGLPLPTRILLSSHFWILPILFTGAAVLNIAKRLAHFSRRQLDVVNVALIFIGAVLPVLILWFLYMPLFSLIGKR